MASERASVAETKLTPTERAAILEQLERMLLHPAFKNSKRCTSLLRYLVEHAIESPSTYIKERTLGIDVFGRDANYDTAVDPVVRMTASEIRKRIAQYYHEHEFDHNSELRIELPSGTYMPEFRFDVPAHSQTAGDEKLPPAPAENQHRSSGKQRYWSFLHARWFRYGGIPAIAVLIVAFCAMKYIGSQSNFARFWSPLLKSPNRVLICIGTGQLPGINQLDSSPQGKSAIASHLMATANQQNQMPPSQDTSTNDVKAISRIIGLLESRKKAYELRAADMSSLDNLRAGPVILVGVANNSWTQRLTSALRYRFVNDNKTRIMKVVDSTDPAHKYWAVPMDQKLNEMKDDYAVVSRYTDDVTDTPVLAVAGMRSYGTMAAAEFVTNPRYLNALGKSLSGCNRNVQFVLQAKVIDGVPGTPQVLARYCW